MKQSALVLEGGALRILFSCGVTDVFMENNIHFPCICGVSAGSLCGLNYISGQIGRTAKINIDFANDKNYLGIHSLIKNKMIFNFDYLFGEISHDLVPFDYDAFDANTENLVAFTTDCQTGKSLAHEKNKSEDIFMACRASSSMPLFSKTVNVDNHICLDGGPAMPIPYQWAFDHGFEKVVLVLTRDINYRKKPLSAAVKKLYAKEYAQYPQFLNTLYNIPNNYNSLVEKIIKLENEGKIFVIRPQVPVTVKRTEKNVKKLRELYEQGREEGKNRMNEMLEFLNK